MHFYITLALFSSPSHYAASPALLRPLPSPSTLLTLTHTVALSLSHSPRLCINCCVWHLNLCHAHNVRPINPQLTNNIFAAFYKVFFLQIYFFFVLFIFSFVYLTLEKQKQKVKCIFIQLIDFCAYVCAHPATHTHTHRERVIQAQVRMCGAQVFTWHLAVVQYFNLIYVKHMKLYSIWDFFCVSSKNVNTYACACVSAWCTYKYLVNS